MDKKMAAQGELCNCLCAARNHQMRSFLLTGKGTPPPEKSVNDNCYTGLQPEIITLLLNRERSVSAGEHTCLLRSFQT